MTEQQSGSFPSPLILAVGMGKGGVSKTWFAENIASFLAKRGYRVLALDANPKPDLFKDVYNLARQGVDLKFEAKLASGPGDCEREIEAAQGQYDFVVIDTSQYPDEHPGSRYAWMNAHLFCAPITADCTDFENFRYEVEKFGRQHENRVPLIILPTRVPSLKNNEPRKLLEIFMSELGGMPHVIIPSLKNGCYLDYNMRVQTLTSRSIYAPGAVDKLSVTFVTKAEILFEQIEYTIAKIYRVLPRGGKGTLSSLKVLEELAA